MRKVSHHSSVVILERENSSRFMFHEYDNTYPRATWRNTLNLIGGNYNHQKPTSSPRDLLFQELCEEFSTVQDSGEMEKGLVSIVGEGPGAPKVDKFAPSEDIKRILDATLQAQSYQDFVFTIPPLDGKPQLSVVSSVFYAGIPADIFDLAEDHLRNGRSIRNEGSTVVVNFDDLVSGNARLAWGTGRIMGHYLGRDLPNPHGVEIESIGVPKGSFKEYLDFLNYDKTPA